MADDGVTGTRVEVEVEVDLSAGEFWDLITDVTRIGQWSPECRYAGWIAPATWPPRAGDRFEAHNEFPNGMANDVTCLITEATRPDSYAWVVLDDTADPQRPAARWRYDLFPTDQPGRTRVRHSFEHGPGESRLREIIRSAPEQSAAIVEIRRKQLWRNMTGTIETMVRRTRPAGADAG
ncbi:SRPBCC family protein [Micromonospora sp. CPCC 206060]|uniref:SRPBCC family protein n=1 Tax=Micromonospora sp. CPCC 206060 TaxID=3122406 RepID=UPI002FF1C023